MNKGVREIMGWKTIRMRERRVGSFNKESFLSVVRCIEVAKFEEDLVKHIQCNYAMEDVSLNG